MVPTDCQCMPMPWACAGNVARQPTTTMKNIFRHPTPQELIRQQLDEAMRMELECRAIAEAYQAKANMYSDRIKRLEQIPESLRK